VRQTAGQLANTLHLLRLHELTLGLPLLCNVAQGASHSCAYPKFIGHGHCIGNDNTFLSVWS
jgi:hypothetical protein